MNKENLMKVFQELFSVGKLEKSINASFITLIPQKTGATEVKDFCPISLVNKVYKIHSKVLTNQFEEVLRTIISKTQNAFVKGRDKS